MSAASWDVAGWHSLALSHVKQVYMCGSQSIYIYIYIYPSYIGVISRVPLTSNASLMLKNGFGLH